jgi:bla regulator protein blaR1
MIAALSNHLWQSTVFGLAAALLAFVLRGNQARVRYWVWLAASVKFLIPFSPLVALGTHIGWRRTYAPAAVTFPLIEAVQPYAPIGHAALATPAIPNLLPIFVIALWFFGAAAVLFLWWLRWRRIARMLEGARPLTAGREIETLRRLGARIPAVSSSAPLEPGVFGIWRPILFWPAGISERLSDSQLESILAHETSHVRRRDNLAAAIHMLVEAVFWFHPLVWWIGARLVEERELACDEAAVDFRGEPRAYAEGILKVCEYCIEAPLACVSGVSGADLKRRVQAILAQRGTRGLTRGRKVLLAASALMALALPIGIGVWIAPPTLAQSATSIASTGATATPRFEVASIKPAAPDQRGMMIRPGPNGGINISNLPLKEMITLAWKIQPFQVSGGPSWIESLHWDITATGNHKFNPDEMPLLVQSLLLDRFQLKIHHETKDLPVYALVLANKDGKLGPQLTESKEASCTPFDPSKPPPPPPPPGRDPGKPPAMGCGGMFMGFDRLGAAGITIDRMVPMLSRMLGRTVIDKTGLTGKYDIQMQWTPDQAQLQTMAPPGGIPPNMPQPQIDPNGPTIFTALQEQLGLKLESQKGPVDILVIDSVEKPSEN